jgi:hypothetical protein
MKNKIKENIDNPHQLEVLFKADRKEFKKSFMEIYPEIAENRISGFWKTRLEFESLQDDSVKIRKKDILFLIISCVVSGLLIKIPQIFNTDLIDQQFYEKNAGLIVLAGLSLYAFLIKDSIKTGHLVISVAVFAISAFYINFLPHNALGDSVILAYLHLPLMLWCLYGLIFIDFGTKDKIRRIDYIKYNGELAILMALIAIAGGILTGVTIHLFAAIELQVEEFYVNYIVVSGMVSVPIVATFIIRKYPFIANKIAPVIANIFSPIVLITLIVYLVSIIVAGKDPYNDRDFLIIFNAMLLGVMAIVVFSISGTSVNKRQRFNERTLFALTIVTLLIDLVALSAILYRLGEYGFTPNRAVVLGSNLLIFGNLVLIMIDLYLVNFKNKQISVVEMTIARYLPVYTFWTIFVVFGIPLIFGFN